ncbi:hypothetical protein [Streptomyces sp. NPDC048442]|uniref:hypothetical protein n=1 Tax=Streptomyces sp. NPDC048442 TaxID=3154823 RepID=UPI00342C2983
MLNPQKPFLCVVQATIVPADRTGTTITSHAMPAAPFGVPAWQLPGIAAYLNRLHRTGDNPRPEDFTAHLESRSRTAVPSPARPYLHAPLHDSSVTCLIDIALTPATSMGWPGVSLVVHQMEPGRCGFTRTETFRGCHAALVHTENEITAEHQRLASRARECRTGGVRELRDLAEATVTWMRKLTQASRADLVMARAAAVRTKIRH